MALAFAIVGGFVASAIGVTTVVSVTARALLVKPIPGDVEITQIGIALAISLCLPWCQLHRGNIIVDFFTQKIAPRRQERLDAFGALLLAAMCALLSWRTAVGAGAVKEAGETSMILALPMWWAYASLAPGLALTAVIALVQAWYGLRGRTLLASDRR